MYKVLLVDDEDIFLTHLYRTVEWKEFDCLVCGSARDGREALQAVEELNPDIVFMDINLPHKNGLEVCDIIREWKNAPHVIILTAHGEFSFAHKAIRMGIFDYLLKPFDKKELTEALLKCIEDIRMKKGQREIEERLQTREAEAYFKDLLDLDGAETGKKIQLSRETRFLAAVVQLEYLEHENLMRISREIKEGLDRDDKIKSYLIGLRNGVFTVVHLLTRDLDIKRMKSMWAEVLSRICDQEEGRDCVALGKLVDDTDAIAVSYQQALTALENRSRTGTSVIAYEDVEDLHVPETMFSQQDMNLLIKLFENGQYESADKAIEKIFGLSEERMLSFQYVVSIYYSIVVQILGHFACEGSREAYTAVDQKELLKELGICTNTQEITEILKNNIHEVFSECISIQLPKKGDILANKIEKYLCVHYRQSNLSVEQIARELFFENSYVRRVFKSQTGKTIVQRLEEIRMEKAKELLADIDVRHSDVAEAVGYADPFYFSKRFKLYSGMSPTEYQARFHRHK